MSWFVRCSTYAYRGILVVYPVELRYEYGAEMAGVFAEELEDAWQIGSAGDVLRVWWRAVSEILWIAIPGRLGHQGVPAPAMGMMVQLALVASVLALVAVAQESMPHDVFHGVVMLQP